MVVSIKMGYQCVFTNLMNNSFQFKYRELRLLVLFLLIVLEMRSSASLECAACFFVLFFFQKTVSMGKNLLKICKPVINEEPSVRPWERHWKRVTHGETVRVERSANIISITAITDNQFLRDFLGNQTNSYGTVEFLIQVVWYKNQVPWLE